MWSSQAGLPGDCTWGCDEKPSESICQSPFLQSCDSCPLRLGLFFVWLFEDTASLTWLIDSSRLAGYWLDSRAAGIHRTLNFSQLLILGLVTLKVALIYA